MDVVKTNIEKIGGSVILDSILCKTSDSQDISLVIINVNNRRIAVKVDRFYKECEFVIKSLTGPLAHIEGFSGATVTSQGKVVLVLDPLKLF